MYFMRMLVLLFTILIFCFSCNPYQSKMDELKAANDSLKLQLNVMEDDGEILRGDYADAINTLNSIDDSIATILDRDKQIKELDESLNNEKSSSYKEEVLAKISELKKANEQSKTQVKQLEAALQKYKNENLSLKRMIDQAEERVTALEEEISGNLNLIGEMKATINRLEREFKSNQSELALAYNDMKEKNEKLSEVNDKLKVSIEDLKNKDEFINKETWAYICCGNKRFLRQKNILSDNSMKLVKGFQTNAQQVGTRVNYFKREVLDCNSDEKIIALLPERDASSYKISGNKVLIENPALFWKTDKIVVLVKN